MSAEKKFESLPKNVQKLVRKLAKVGREELALLQDNTKNDVTEEIGVLFEQEDMYMCPDRHNWRLGCAVKSVPLARIWIVPPLKPNVIFHIAE